MDKPFTKELTIRFSETDNRGNFKVVSMFDCFQDVGSEHAALLGLSAPDLLTKNYTWVMLKYNVRIERLPRWNDRVVMKTWRYPHKNLYELREFDILDMDGNMMIRGLSSWVMMNFNSRKPVRLDRFIPKKLMENQSPVDDEFSRLVSFRDFEYEKQFNVRMQDIDFNNHVNNSVYIGWAAETVPQDIFTTHSLKQVEVNYIDEISYGHKIYSLIKKDSSHDDIAYVHQILGGEEQRELTRLKTIWHKDEHGIKP
ncbi:MAG: hypothetical protein KKD44_19405 [Proteobacteria bacterium]|nr:hypothetical protein [Pseudomonadota bacterium]